MEYLQHVNPWIYIRSDSEKRTVLCLDRPGINLARSTDRSAWFIRVAEPYCARAGRKGTGVVGRIDR
jgi:hypothetical protein